MSMSGKTNLWTKDIHPVKVPGKFTGPAGQPVERFRIADDPDKVFVVDVDKKDKTINHVTMEDHGRGQSEMSKEDWGIFRDKNIANAWYHTFDFSEYKPGKYKMFCLPHLPGCHMVPFWKK